MISEQEHQQDEDKREREASPEKKRKATRESLPLPLTFPSSGFSSSSSRTEAEWHCQSQERPEEEKVWPQLEGDSPRSSSSPLSSPLLPTASSLVPFASSWAKEERASRLDEKLLEMESNLRLYRTGLKAALEKKNDSAMCSFLKLIEKLENERNELESEREYVLRKLELTSLLESKEVSVRLKPCSNQFLTTAWLQETIRIIVVYMKKADSGMEKAPPMGLVRCSRGGKTRALYEIGIKFKELYPDCAVIYVCFNNDTAIQEQEQANPVKALCLRIAFAALKPDSPYSGDFRSFSKNVIVEENHIIKWLKQSPCLILVDELNRLKKAVSDDQFAFFIKDVFLTQKGRYIVFSSHIISVAKKLESYLLSWSRNVLIRELPTTSLKRAKEAFNIDTLTAREALFCGLIPGLILDKCFYGASDKVNWRIDDYLSQLTEDQIIDTTLILPLLESFITGSPDNLPPVILEMMNVLREFVPVKKEFRDVVQWIPMHMVKVLHQLSESNIVSNGYRKLLKVIEQHFENFHLAKYQSGDAWESLCVIVLIIRIVTRQPKITAEVDLLAGQFSAESRCTYSVSYNEHFQKHSNFEACVNLEQLKGIIRHPPNFPHVSIYYPSHARFLMYDAIVVLYESEICAPCFIGFQMKEGRELPTRRPSDVCLGFLLRGKSAKNPQAEKWKDLSTNEVNEFFGVSGRSWTPEEWGKLAAEEEEEQCREATSRTSSRQHLEERK